MQNGLVFSFLFSFGLFSSLSTITAVKPLNSKKKSWRKNSENSAKVWKCVSICQKVWKSAGTILPFCCCPKSFPQEGLWWVACLKIPFSLEFFQSLALSVVNPPTSYRSLSECPRECPRKRRMCEGVSDGVSPAPSGLGLRSVQKVSRECPGVSKFKDPDPPILAFLDFLAFLVFRFSLLFLAFFLPFPRILGVPRREKPLLFWGKNPCVFQKSKGRRVREDTFLTLRGHSWDTFEHSRARGPKGPGETPSLPRTPIFGDTLGTLRTSRAQETLVVAGRGGFTTPADVFSTN